VDTSINSRSKVILKKPLVEEDFESWERYKNTEHRWVFNKLEVAMMQGLHAGPAATAPQKSGTYIQRPTYNVYGMGISAKQFVYDKENDYERMINHDLVPPGSFWCEWLSGEHLSIDYNQDVNGFWHTRSVWSGEHNSKDNLTRFSSWERLHNDYAPRWNELPLDPSFLYDPNVPVFNVEMIGEHIIEIHLRLGNDPFDEYPVGSELIPVWNDEIAPQGEWKGNLHSDMEMYSASGYLSDVRRGYVVRRP
jgi:hypothetical protein